MGEGNVFSLFTSGGGGGQVQPVGGVRSSRGGEVRSSWLGGGSGPAGGGGQVQSVGGVRSSWPGGGQVQPGGGQVQLAGGGSGPAGGGGVRILRPLAGSIPLAFTQEDFLVINQISTQLTVYAQ